MGSPETDVEVGVATDRDLHLLLPIGAHRVLVVGGADVATGLRLAGHEVDEEPTGACYDVAVLISPHRMTGTIGEQVAALDAAVRPQGALVVVDRPRTAWPDLLGRRDPVTGRRFGHGAIPAGRIRRALSRHRPVKGEFLLSVHDQRYRHLVSAGAPAAARRLALSALWQEASLPGRSLVAIIARAPRRVALATSPVVAFVATSGSLPRIFEHSGAVAFLGSRMSPAVTLVRPGAGVKLVHPDPRWSPEYVVEAADALRNAGIEGVVAAEHRCDGDAVSVEWLSGRSPGSADRVCLAATLGRIHAATACGEAPLDHIRIGRAHSSAAHLAAEALAVAPEPLRAPLRALEGSTTAVAWMHGDWSARNCRISDEGVGVFDLEFAAVRGSAGFDIGWYLLQPGVAGGDVVTAYETAAGRKVTASDLALGLAGMVIRYGPDRASAAWAQTAKLSLD